MSTGNPHSSGAAAKEVALACTDREHRTPARVLVALETTVRDIERSSTPAAFPLLASMLHCIAAMPERLHHPRKERRLLPARARRGPASAESLQRLREAHERSPLLLPSLDIRLVRRLAGARDGPTRFADAGTRFADPHGEPLRSEETQVLPRAAEVLRDEDRIAIVATFGAHADSLFGSARAAPFGRLCPRIVDLAPRRLRAGLLDHGPQPWAAVRRP